MSVWVSACPCAFGLATPTAVLVATGVAASRGLLFRKGAALQYLSEVDSVALDKTGTITNGKMSVIDCHRVGSNDTMTLGIEELSWVDIYMMVLKVELRSSHPLAKGIVNYCQQLPKVAQALSNEFEYSKKRQKIHKKYGSQSGCSEQLRNPEFPKIMKIIETKQVKLVKAQTN